MPCYNPINGYRSKSVNNSGKRSIVFQLSQGYKDMPVSVPCGQCIGCRLERSRQWAMRCVHEASLYENNCFITLTYSPEHVPEHNSLVVSHFQKFMKRLRKKYSPQTIRFFQCGEYGEKNERPHYHACLFNFDFTDKLLYRTIRDTKLYVSSTLDNLWPFGFSTIGDVTFESAAYVARYVTKKITGKYALHHYNTINSGGEILAERHPEYTTMSRRPGIGRDWYEKFTSDVFPSDYLIVNEKKVRPPKYYDRLFDQFDPTQHQQIKAKRAIHAKQNSVNNTLIRLNVRETIQLEKLKQLKRSYETNET